VRIASFSRRENASTLVRTLDEKGYEADIEEVTLDVGTVRTGSSWGDTASGLGRRRSRKRSGGKGIRRLMWKVNNRF